MNFLVLQVYYSLNAGYRNNKARIQIVHCVKILIKVNYFKNKNAQIDVYTIELFTSYITAEIKSKIHVFLVTV